ncbi:paraquat-inducible protein A [Chitinasiproducens palmae]|uniref:Paraquat-inducible protein A n=1 Tax=Chitinasiproducens palmae TaxID=1770053 RepID=A0A1H2PRM7_9BURK|nr:paraquat-inducible protein A [Chitinasiproducens palmae]SDV49502.1 paraquat-inducible protein A [Chitinasiproducens palmae]
MQQHDLIACPECDTLHRRVALRGQSVARCRRCRAVLYQTTPRRLDRVLALTVTALILLIIANVFPIVELQLQGVTTKTTLVGGVMRLWEDGRSLLAVIVLCSALLFPATEIAALLYLLVPLSLGRRPGGFDGMVRAIQAVRPWGMIEVFMLGVVVTLVKLSSVARLIPEPAVFAFAALTLTFAMLTMFDPRSLWQYLDFGRASLPDGPAPHALRAADDGMARSLQTPQ